MGRNDPRNPTIGQALDIARERIAKLEARLEIDHAFRMGDGDEMVRYEIPPEERDNFPDGIACRDETIRLRDELVDELAEDLALAMVTIRNLISWQDYKEQVGKDAKYRKGRADAWVQARAFYEKMTTEPDEGAEE